MEQKGIRNLEGQKNIQKKGDLELIDFLHIIWKWKWLVISGTFFCALVAVIICLRMPKVFRVDMVVEPGILRMSMKDGRNIYIDSIENIKALIEAGVFNDSISDAHKNKNSTFQSIKFKTSDPGRAKSLKVSFNTSNINFGIDVMNELGRLLMERYDHVVRYYQNEYDREIRKIKTDVFSYENKISSYKNRVQYADKDIGELESKIKFIKEENRQLIKQRNLMNQKKMNDTSLLIFYTNTLQQNLALANFYAKEINENISKREDYEFKIEDEKNTIVKLEQKIKGIESESNMIQNIKILQKPRSSQYPVKPRTNIVVFLATAIGFFVTLFLVFLIEYIKREWVGKLSKNP